MLNLYNLARSQFHERKLVVRIYSTRESLDKSRNFMKLKPPKQSQTITCDWTVVKIFEMIFSTIIGKIINALAA